MNIPIANAVIVQDNKVLLVQQRKQSAYGLWSFPGGHVENGESLIDAVLREVKEEVGVTLLNPLYVNATELHSDEGLLVVHMFVGSIEEPLQLNDEELLAYGWFSLESLETMRSSLRSPIIFPNARDALNNKRNIRNVA